MNLPKLSILPLLLLSAGWISRLPAAERVALVIGNNAYRHGVPLKNCVNDARAVEKSLKAAGFEVVLAEDAGLQQMEAKVLEFRRKAQGAKAAWFHYSGHGAEVAGTNYLIPVDTSVEEEFQVKYKTYPLDQVMAAMEGAGAPLKVVVLDCCRNNPFGRGWSRSGSSGLAQVGDAPSGTIIAFATSPGKVAEDGDAGNSPFTAALVASLSKPGLEIEQVFIETGRLVKQATGDRQVPWRNSSFYGSFIPLAASGVVPPVLPPVPAAAAVSPLDRGVAGSSVEVKLPGEVPMVFQYCPAGSFTMGSPKSEEGRSDEENQVSVRITRGFWLARTECTQAQWRAVMGTDRGRFKGDDLPVESVSWQDAEEFVTKLNKAGPPAGWEWALPTEAQWEYACRAGTTTAFSFGESAAILARHGNFADKNYMEFEFLGDKKQDDGVGDRTAKVGSYAANKWGFHDMQGNVYEWCADWHSSTLGGGVDPTGPSPLSGFNRVLRGGAWDRVASTCRSAARTGWTPGTTASDLGFRPALVPSR